MVTYQIKNSKFIAETFQVQNKQEVYEYLKFVDQKFKNASHICYAYVVNNGKDGGKSDSGEPKNSVGMPLLKLMQTKKQTNLLLVVVRYYGGIKLGKSKLTVSYLKVAAKILETIT